jgi:hypothetical protein
MQDQNHYRYCLASGLKHLSIAAALFILCVVAIAVGYVLYQPPTPSSAQAQQATLTNSVPIPIEYSDILFFGGAMLLIVAFFSIVWSYGYFRSAARQYDYEEEEDEKPVDNIPAGLKVTHV